MTRQATRTWLRLSAAIALSTCVSAFAQTYNKWVAVELPVASGASCSDGSPYRFFVNRSARTTKTIVVYEGGGACWDQTSCKGGNLLSASNPNGVPANYMTKLTTSASTPFLSRFSLLGDVQTQSWNIVFAPYCTGDVHAGSALGIYNDVDPSKPLAYRHSGAANSVAMAAWLKANLPQPEQLLVTGFSAGGAGATAHYSTVRTALNPKESALLADSGPLYPAMRNGSSAQYPSLPMQNKIRQAWGLDTPNGLVTKLLAQYPGAGNVDNLGSLTTGLATIFPNDRIGYAVFQQDGIYSDFSYTKFYPEIAATTGAAKQQLLNVKWRQDIDNWLAAMQPLPNIGYLVPQERGLMDSHCLTVITFANTGIPSQRVRSVVAFVDNLLDKSKPVMRAKE